MNIAGISENRFSIHQKTCNQIAVICPNIGNPAARADDLRYRRQPLIQNNHALSPLLLSFYCTIKSEGEQEALLIIHIVVKINYILYSIFNVKNRWCPLIPAIKKHHPGRYRVGAFEKRHYLFR